MKEQINKLITEVEKLREPSVRLNFEIATILGLVPQHSIREIGFDYDWYRNPNGYALWKANDSEGRNMSLWQPLNYTGSIDAAMTMIPEPYMLDTLSDYIFDGLNGCKLVGIDRSDVYSFGTSSHATSIVAASLRAMIDPFSFDRTQ